MAIKKSLGVLFLILFSMSLVSAVPTGLTISYPAEGGNYGAEVTSMTWGFSGELNPSLDKCWYRLNAGEWTEFSCLTNPVMALSDIEGNNIWTLKINDSINSVEKNVNFWVDSIAPEITINIPTDPDYFSVLTIPFNVNIFELNPKNPATLKLLDLDLAEWWVWSTNLISGDNSIIQVSNPMPDDGNYIYSVTAKDTVNHISTKTGTVIIDRVDPTVSINSPEEGADLVGMINIDTTASDDRSGIASIDLSITQGEYTYADSCASESCSFIWDSTAVSDGAVLITATATDKAGNSASDAINIEVDNTDPEISFDSPEAGVYNIMQTISISASDAHLSSIVLYIDGIPFANSEISPLNSDLSEEGNHIVYAVATDSFGNSAQTEERNILIDTNPPVVEAGADAVTNSEILQNATASDELSGIASYQWAVESGPGDCSVNFGTPNSEDTTISATCDGNYIISLTVTDAAGNSASDTMNLLWDTSAPTTSAELNPEEAADDWVNENVEVTLTAEDELSGVADIYYCITQNLGGCEPADIYTEPLVISDEGVNFVLFFSIDNAGNTGEPGGAIVPIDKSGPEITLTWPDNNAPFAFDDNTITFTFDVVDALNNMVGGEEQSGSCSIYLNDELWQTSDWLQLAESPQFTIEDIAAGANYNWKIECSDYLENSNPSETRSFTILLEFQNSGNFEDFTDLTAEEDISSVLGFFVENAFGKIKWLEAIDFSTGFDWSLLVSITENLISVDSTTPELNKSAEITIYNISFANPDVIEILRDGEVCIEPVCNILGYNSTEKTLVFNVTGFTNYSSQQGAYCGDGSCNNGETCSSCSQDCGECSAGGGGGGGGGCDTCSPEEAWKCIGWGDCIDEQQTCTSWAKVGDCCYYISKPVETEGTKECGAEEQGTGEAAPAGEERGAEGEGQGFIAGITGAAIGTTAGRVITGIVVLAILIIIVYIVVKIKRAGHLKSEIISRSSKSSSRLEQDNPVLGKKTNPIMNKLSGKQIDESKKK